MPPKPKKSPHSSSKNASRSRKSLCQRCRGELAIKRVEHPYWNGSTLVAIIQNVPAKVCQSCGYHHFDSSVETSMQLLVQDYVKMGTVFPIPSTPFRTLS